MTKGTRRTIFIIIMFLINWILFEYIGNKQYGIFSSYKALLFWIIGEFIIAYILGYFLFTGSKAEKTEYILNSIALFFILGFSSIIFIIIYNFINFIKLGL